jgi:serine/threonine protein kinase
MHSYLLYTLGVGLLIIAILAVWALWWLLSRSTILGRITVVLSLVLLVLAGINAYGVIPWPDWFRAPSPWSGSPVFTATCLGLGLGLLVAALLGLFRSTPAVRSRSDTKPGPSPTGPDQEASRDPDPVGIFAEAAVNRATQGAAPAVEELSPHFPEFELLELLGQGGMGAVYRVRRRADAMLLALKVVRISDEDREGFAARFAREAEALTRLDHPNIVAIRGHGRAGPWCWLLMDLVEGANLRQVVATGRLSPAQTLALVPPLCAALQYAHDRGVVHRDIKPENILLDAAGQPRIVDFGLAKLARAGEHQHTRTGAVMGTPHYMAPEQVEEAKDVDHRADIYALGVVVYELLTGRLPLGRFEPPSHRVAVDVRIDEVVLKALERDPERRWQQAGQVGRAVDAIDRSNAHPAASAPPAATGSAAGAVQAWGMEVQTFCILLHLSQFAGCLIPVVGWILPLVMWLTCRHRHPAIDNHGRAVFNWLISSLIYAIICVPLCLILIGIPLLIALVVMGFIFPIIGAIRAGRGEVWNYPLSIPFCGRGEAVPVEPGRPIQARSAGGGGCLIVIAVLAVLAVLVLGVVLLRWFFLSPQVAKPITQSIDLSQPKMTFSSKDYASLIQPLIESLSANRRRETWPVQGKPLLAIGRIDIQDSDGTVDGSELRAELVRQLTDRHLQPVPETDGPEANANLELIGKLYNTSNSISYMNGRPWGSRSYRLSLSLKAITSEAVIWQDSTDRTINWP